MDDDNDDLIFDEGAPAPMAPRPAPPIEQRAHTVPEEERVIPPIVETIAHNDRGEAYVLEDVPRYFWARAHHNLPGWNLWLDEKNGPREGWIPNDEEGVRAVELGWAEIASVPDGVMPPA